MIDYKHRINFYGIDVYIPRELADGGDDEAIREYIRDYVKSHVHCQQLANGMVNEDKMGEQIAKLGQNYQEWANIKADVEAMARVSKMKHLQIYPKRRCSICQDSPCCCGEPL